MEFTSRPEIKKLENLKVEQFGQVARQVLFSPKTTCNNFLKMAYINVPPGSAGTPHVHLGEEIVFTLSGKVILTIEGKEYLLEAGTCFMIPPEVEHPAKVVGDENWVAIAAYCDECQVLKNVRSKEDVDYPVTTRDSI